MMSSRALHQSSPTYIFLYISCIHHVDSDSQANAVEVNIEQGSREASEEYFQEEDPAAEWDQEEDPSIDPTNSEVEDKPRCMTYYFLISLFAFAFTFQELN